MVDPRCGFHRAPWAALHNINRGLLSLLGMLNQEKA